MIPLIKINKTKESRLTHFDFDNIDFGLSATDHMFIADFQHGDWQSASIVPFQNLHLDPMALCLHYGQTVFEGMKAFRMDSGDINIFRAERHHSRINISLLRMCMPEIPKELFLDALESLVSLEQGWVSDKPGNSLYLRPFIIATEARLGVKISDEYRFIIVCAPMGSYYAGSIKVKVETEYVRAMSGGAGYAKNGGNYGAALYPTQLAKNAGFDQVIWTDGKENKYIEESGTMNVMFIFDDVLVTPALSGTILDGITRDSIMTLAREDGLKVEERNISYQELEDAFKSGKKVEAFGTGTAVVITPIELIDIKGRTYRPDVSSSAKLQGLKQRLHNIRTGKEPDKFGWNHILRIGHSIANEEAC